MSLNITTTRDRLQKFEFAGLFIEELGWSNPKSRNPVKAQVKDSAYTRTPIAQLSGVVAFEVTTGDRIPDSKVRAAIHKHVAEEHVENLLIFLDKDRTQSLWYWVKHESGKAHARDHLYVKGQPGDLFLSKLAAMVVDISELDAEGNIPVTEVAGRLKAALDVERVTKKFYGEFDTQRLAFVELIQGISDDHQRRWYASVLMNRLMFIWFLQRKGFLDGADREYLTGKLAASKKRGVDKFYSVFLKSLFFEGFAKPEQARGPDTRALLGNIRYLNGGLFLPHRVELEHGFPDKLQIKIPDAAFANIFTLFSRYSWNLNDTPGGDDQEINPDVLGYIFEKYINQKEFGAYYTRPEMTGYLCERTIYKLVLDRVSKALDRRFANISDLLLILDANLCRVLLFEVLPSLRLLDPACGSAAFLVAAMKVLIAIYSAAIGKIQFLNDTELTKWHKQTRAEHPSVLYFIKKQIITNNLFGVDIMEEATEIGRLRLFLALVASAQTEEQLEPLPNIDFNILAGNSLIGLLRVDAAKFDAGQTKTGGSQERMILQHGSDLGFTVETKTAPTKEEKTAAFVAKQTADRFAAILEHKNKSIELYRKHAFERHDLDAITQDVALIQLRADIENVRRESYDRLNRMLLDEFSALGIQFEQSTWNKSAGEEGEPEKRNLKPNDIQNLFPFHWAYEFDKVLAEGGFDGIVTNPPWEIFKPQAKEFCARHSDLVTKKKMTIHDFEEEQAKLMRDADICDAWLGFKSQFPHQIVYFRKARQFANQVSEVNGRKVGADVNLYKVFLEQTFNLLKEGGQCGIVIPSGIYTDLGAKQLRQMLFEKTAVEGLFCFENRKEIFEGVDSRFKFVVLTFEKGGRTTDFPAAFMRHDVSELNAFPNAYSLRIPLTLVQRISPDSLSVPEFKTQIDIGVADKLLKFPFLNDGDKGWGLEIYGEELHMNRASHLFKNTPTKTPLYEGGMIWQFDHQYERPQYWISEKEIRASFLEKRVKRTEGLKTAPKDMRNDYETFRLAFRKIASNTNERTLIVAIIPPGSVTGNSLSVHFPFYHDKDRYDQTRFTDAELLLLTALLNSFVVDFSLRAKMTTNLNTFFLYQLSIPRLPVSHAAFVPIVKRAAQLICNGPEFDVLIKQVSTALKLPASAVKGVKDSSARIQLRAELDALIAQLYGLSESEFAHILTTFPLVDESVKQQTLNTYRDLLCLGKLPDTRT